MTHTGCLLATSDNEIGKIGPGPEGVAVKIRPYFILALGGGPATAVGLGFVSFSTDEDLSVGPHSDPIFNSCGVPGVLSLRAGAERHPPQ